MRRSNNPIHLVTSPGFNFVILMGPLMKVARKNDRSIYRSLELCLMSQTGKIFMDPAVLMRRKYVCLWVGVDGVGLLLHDV